MFGEDFDLSRSLVDIGTDSIMRGTSSTCICQLGSVKNDWNG